MISIIKLFIQESTSEILKKGHSSILTGAIGAGINLALGHNDHDIVEKVQSGASVANNLRKSYKDLKNKNYQG